MLEPLFYFPEVFRDSFRLAAKPLGERIGPAYCWAFTGPFTVIGGDGAGRIHFLSLELPETSR